MSMYLINKYCTVADGILEYYPEWFHDDPYLARKVMEFKDLEEWLENYAERRIDKEEQANDDGH